MNRRQKEARATGFDELQELLRELADSNAETRAKRTSELLTDQQDLVGELSRMRREALEELIADGASQKQLAELLGMSRTRVSQLLASGPKPARALLGTGRLTVAIGGNPKSQPKTTNPSAMISEESSHAYQLICETAATYGLSALQEVVRPPGIVHLNRPNLIVIGSPRLLPVVSQSLDADDNLGFSHGTQGSYLTEQGRAHRSPCDSGEPADYGYIGRLPRPDTKGTFLYITGIHAMGTLGAATYLTGNIDNLYLKVKNRRWSVLIECRYDPNTRQIKSVNRITEIY